MALHLSCVMFLTLVPAADAKPDAYPRPDLLLEAAELMKPETAQRFRIVDVRPKEKYQAGHIPGAVQVSPFLWGREFATNQDREAWAQRLGMLGIDVETPVVVYGDGAVNEVARIWWILRYWGVKDVRLLNGGWLAWQNVVGKVSQDEPKVAATAPKLAPRADRLATKDQVLASVKGKSCQIIDARSAGEYAGEVKTEKRSGAIPGAAHLEWSDVLDKKTQRFKSPEEIAKLFKDAGIDPKQPAVTYCQSGGRAAALAFTLELMGAKDVRNYYRSWSEWGSAEDTPIVTPKK